MSQAEKSQSSAYIAPRSGAWVAVSDAVLVIGFTAALIVLSSTTRVLGYASGGTSFEKLFELNAGELLAFLAIWSLANRKDSPIRLAKSDLVVLSACSLFFLPGEPQSLPFVGATIAGLYFNWRRPNPDLRAIGKLWLALSTCEVWGRVLFKLLAVPVLRLEAVVVVALGRLIGFDLTLDGVQIHTTDNRILYLLDACSSFHNLTLAFLIWFSLLKLSDAQPGFSRYVALIVGVVGIIFLNTSRILLMTRSDEAYVFWHLGNGQVIYSTLALLAAAVPIVALTGRSRS